MQRKHELRSDKTLANIQELINQGIKKIAVIMRHSDRFFCEDARMEPFMGLTSNGKGYAQDMGAQLPTAPVPQMFSSFFGRCIETAYLIDKGYTKAHDKLIAHNVTCETLAPFYINDLERGIAMVEEQGSLKFIRNWFDGNIDESIMVDPQKTAQRLADFMVERLDALDENEMALCVSHDWNLFPLKEFYLGLKHEEAGDVGYLEGVIFFEKEGSHFITHYQGKPTAL